MIDIDWYLSILGFLKYAGYPKASKSSDHFSIEAHSDLGVPHF